MYLRCNVRNFNAHHSIASEKRQKCACPPGCHVSITANRSWSWWIPVGTAESFVLGINADCNLSHWRQKADDSGFFLSSGKGALQLFYYSSGQMVENIVSKHAFKFGYYVKYMNNKCLYHTIMYHFCTCIIIGLILNRTHCRDNFKWSA